MKRYSLQDFLALPVDSREEYQSEFELKCWEKLEKLALKYPKETKRPVFGIDLEGGKQSWWKEYDSLKEPENRSDLYQYFPEFGQNSCRIRGKSVSEERAEQIIWLFGPDGPLYDSILVSRFLEEYYIFGFCHPDGAIGLDYYLNTGNKHFLDILLELSLYSIFLKDLDMVVAVSEIEGLWPFDYQGEAALGWYVRKSLEWNEKTFAESGGKFEDTIEWVIWFHDGVIDFLQEAYDLAKFKYVEYEIKYNLHLKSQSMHGGGKYNKYSPCWYR